MNKFSLIAMGALMTVASVQALALQTPGERPVIACTIPSDLDPRITGGDVAVYYDNSTYIEIKLADNKKVNLDFTDVKAKSGRFEGQSAEGKFDLTNVQGPGAELVIDSPVLMANGLTDGEPVFLPVQCRLIID